MLPLGSILGIARVLVTLAALLASIGAGAEPYPSKPIHVLHGFQAGGPPDIVLRQLAARLEKSLGQPVIVENRAGASGTIAAAAVARAVPDGHLLLFGVAANLAVAPATMQPSPYDPVRAFTPIAEVARGPYVWLVRSDAPAHDRAEFVAWARSKSGQLNYASPGVGSVHHLGTEMLKRSAAIEMLHVPYTGGLYTALLGGQVDAMFESLPGPLPHLASGKLRALAVTGARRLKLLPGVATLGEQGIGGVEMESWWGLVGPAGLDPAIVAQLHRAVREALAEPAMTETLERMGVVASSGAPATFAATIAQESARWRALALQTGSRKAD